MTSSRTSLAALILLSMMAMPALAQSAGEGPGAPVQLPGADEEEDGEATTGASSIPDVSAGTLIVPGRAGSDDAGITVGVIGVTAEPIGTLNEEEGGFGPALWNGTTPTMAQILLNQIPVGASSPAMASLTRRLILSAAQPEADPATQETILTLRIRKAFESGYVDEVPELIDQADNMAGEEDLEAIRARAMLLAGDGSTACGSATVMRLESEELFWMKLRAYCYAREGFAPAARLTADLLYDLGDNDELFQVLLDRIAGNERANPSRYWNQRLSELHIAMARDAGISPPVDRITSSSLPTMVAIANAENLTGDDGRALRLAAAEEAAWGQALSPEQLLAVYSAASGYDAANRSAVLTQAARTGGIDARAIFGAALAAGGAPAEQAQVVAAALEAGEGEVVEFTYARAVGHAARNVRPQEALSFAGFDMALAALASGRYRDAADWYAMAREAGALSRGQEQSLQVALIMAYPSERFAFWPEQSLIWLERADLGAMPHQRLLQQLIIFEAMGLSPSPVVMDRLSLDEGQITGYMPPEAVRGNLSRAVEEGRLAETVANALVTVGPAGPRGAHPRALAEAITALRAVGLEADARALAAEALTGLAFDARSWEEPEDLP